MIIDIYLHRNISKLIYLSNQVKWKMCVDTKSFKSFLNIIIYVNDRALLIKRYDVGSKKNEKWQRLMSKYVLWWGLQNWHWKNTIHTWESDWKINLSYRHFLLAAYYFWPKWFPSLLCWPITLCILNPILLFHKTF